MVDERTKQLISRIEEQLKAEGYSVNRILESRADGMGIAKSFFEVLVDLKLEGKENPTAQEVWEEMKAHINYLGRNLSKGADDYRKLENKVRHLEQDLDDLRKGR